MSHTVYSSCETYYYWALNELEGISESFTRYFKTACDPIKEIWAGHVTEDCCHQFHFTNNIVEAHNHSTKVRKNSSIVDLVKDLLKLQTSIRAGHLQMVSSMVMDMPSVPKESLFNDQAVVSAVSVRQLILQLAEFMIS